MKFIHKLFHSRMLKLSFPVHSCPRYTANGQGTGKICLLKQRFRCIEVPWERNILEIPRIMIDKFVKSMFYCILM